MRRLAFSVAIVAALASLAGASTLPLTGAGKAPGAAYAGPGDIVTGATHWVGLRAYSLATAGTRFANICLQDGTTCADFSSQANGLPPTLSITGTACDNATHICQVATLYDQSGGAVNLSQATAASRPTIVINCLGSLPCMNFSGSQSIGSSGNVALASTMTTALFGWRATTSAGNEVFWVSNPGASTDLIFANASAATVSDLTGGGTVTAAFSSTVWHALQGVWNGASSVVRVDASETSGTNGTSASTSTITLGTNTTNFLVGRMTEAGVWSATVFTAGNRASMESNQCTFYGVAC